MSRGNSAREGRLRGKPFVAQVSYLHEQFKTRVVRATSEAVHLSEADCEQMLLGEASKKQFQPRQAEDDVQFGAGQGAVKFEDRFRGY